MFKYLLKVLRQYIIEKRCEHDDKIITIPIDFDSKKSDFKKQGIKPRMFKRCIKCKRMESIFNPGG